MLPKGIPQKFIGILFDRNCNLIHLACLITEHLFVLRTSLGGTPSEMGVYGGCGGVHGECSIFGHVERKYIINLLALSN